MNVTMNVTMSISTGLYPKLDLLTANKLHYITIYGHSTTSDPHSSLNLYSSLL
jgi:hypothetical protein